MMRKLRVLLLEDNKLDAELTQANLTDGGIDCEVTRVETRADFIAALENNCVDLILADYSLPAFDGISALKIAQESCPEVPFIFLSGALGEELAIETLKSGATDYVLKQRLQRLVPSVQRALREAEDRKERRRAEQELAQLLAREQAARAEAEAARAEAETANRAKDIFLATVSHELRTPLAAMLGWVRLLRTGKLDQERFVQALEALDRNAQAQAQLVNDLLDVSRIISGKLHLEVRPTDPRLAVEAALEVVRPAAEAKAICLETEFDPTPGLVSGDQVRLQQVFWNLLTNAIKFTHKGGMVKVKVRRINSWLEIAVQDNGQGIEPEFLPYVFERFRQADSSSTRTHGGLGLGLAIVRHLVEMHGGTVQVTSSGKDQGATFTVKLSLLGVYPQFSEAERPTEPELASTNNHLTLTGIRVLVVDDAVDTREILDALLSDYGAEVKTAASSPEAMEVFEQWPPDILVSDIGLPGEDGYALIGRIRERPAEQGGRIPAIALTAYAQAQDRIRALTAGFQLHVPKPVEPAELAAAIVSLLDRTSSSEAAK